jgi:uncharacterized membrane protein
MRIAVIVVLLLITGCIAGSKENIKLNSQVNPAKVALENREEIIIEAHATNIGSSIETITADVTETEGLSVLKPNRTVFTIKKGESRTITITAFLLEDAVPGDYIIDVKIETKGGEIVQDRAKVTVVKEKGLL